jgi:hypothetical protein
MQRRQLRQELAVGHGRERADATRAQDLLSIRLHDLPFDTATWPLAVITLDLVHRRQPRPSGDARRRELRGVVALLAASAVLRGISDCCSTVDVSFTT